MKPFACRFCGTLLEHRVVDLGMSPLCESYLAADQLDGMEPFYPLHVWVCHQCFLVQLNEYVGAEDIFTEYAYFSSFSTSWLEHAEQYVAMVTERFGLDGGSFVVELASNDGYLLQYFVQRGIPCLGIEPAANVAEVALENGVPTDVVFFGRDTAARMRDAGQVADLVLGNNVLAQVPDLNDFVAGIPTILKPGGTVTIEFPHVMRMLDENQFDTIYHEHFSYFSFTAAEKAVSRHGLKVFDVEEIPTHGGSLRLYASHAENQQEPVTPNPTRLRQREAEFGVGDLATYAAFAEQVKETKRRLLAFLIDAKAHGKSIVGYGAPAKGNTLLNYCGIRTDFLDYTVDRSPHKQGRFLPGTHVPIHAPERIFESKPDYVLILPWNIKEEITQKMAGIRDWGGRFVVPIPRVEVLD
jgi:SAM-dependent methyltransferase